MQGIFTPEELSGKLKVSKMVVYKWLKKGELKAFKDGKMWRVAREGLEEFLGHPIPWE
ncbi:helix-turn-helix domain-containing protein [Candidatus Contubernalis alkaliaceticus]|uniref:helix-turn-helix domain-containing protein n=1 Tax=Candidatus Contubernalis alkaliaceticus TaxID=338645 RepID=UPI001F4C0696|nr:helix-turn-helix domain-containing protein [Candidatus Contubernalis alkalaceticus]UNC92401.1 helix-turn-helix domain-containing protein [Candidatus Contubernalis alkalaceticus]